MSENVKKGFGEELANESVKELANTLKKVNVCSQKLKRVQVVELVQHLKLQDQTYQQKQIYGQKLKVFYSMN